jgi:alkyldihydroxyacetonephosphate synthase
MRQRSWWGWGSPEEELTATESAELAERIARLLPGHDLADHPPPDPRTLAVPSPKLTPPASLADLCSPDPVDRLAHARGKAFRDVVRNLHGDVEHVPDLVIRPRTEQDVIDVLDWCSGAKTPVIAYGGGSSAVGGVEPRFAEPAITLDLERLDRVIEIDRTSRAARIQAGVYGPHLEDQLRPHGLTLRHFPQSFGYSTLGGWLATRSGGHFATLYTHIDELTESIRAVTPVGVTQSRRLPGSGAGPSPDRLLLGSEGTLGVITEAWMRLQDRPAFQVSASPTTRPRSTQRARSRSPGCTRRTAGCSTRQRPSSTRACRPPAGCSYSPSSQPTIRWTAGWRVRWTSPRTTAAHH